MSPFFTGKVCGWDVVGVKSLLREYVAVKKKIYRPYKQHNFETPKEAIFAHIFDFKFLLRLF